MKINCNSFFDGYSFKEINLNDFLSNRGVFDAKHPELIQKMIDESFTEGNASFGGYGENRKDMFHGTYLESTGNFIHLGIDINVHAGTPIRLPFDCYLAQVFVDTDVDVGWGTRVILETKSPYLMVLGHLENGMYDILGNGFSKKKGEIIGKVGTWPRNGNVFEHLHVQMIKPENMKQFDGYGTIKDLIDNPNPFEVEFE